jgi:hypothetical protein
MKNTISILLFLSLFVFVACDDNNENNNSSALLTGYWVNPQITDSVTTYERSLKLKDNDYGMAFKSGGVFVERKNSGFCGTPPISYADYEGNWTENDSIINITVGYWGGLSNYRWKLISVDDNALTISLISQEFHGMNE